MEDLRREEKCFLYVSYSDSDSDGALKNSDSGRTMTMARVCVVRCALLDRKSVV